MPSLKCVVKPRLGKHSVVKYLLCGHYFLCRVLGVQCERRSDGGRHVSPPITFTSLFFLSRLSSLLLHLHTYSLMDEEHFIDAITNYLVGLRGRPLFERFYRSLSVFLGIWAVCTVFFGLPAVEIYYFVCGLIEHNMVTAPPRHTYVRPFEY